MSRKRSRTNSGDDPVVREVRAVRRRLWEEGGRTTEGYCKLMEKLAAERRRVSTAADDKVAAPKRRSKKAA